MYRAHFEPYEHVNRGICVLEYERRSPIIFCNRAFATLLETHPDHLEGRSLDEITRADSLHYEEMHPLLVEKNRLVSFLGGFCISCFSQNPNSKRLITLKVSRVKVEKLDGRTFLIGYVRAATWLERQINRFKLDTELDPYLKPAINFFMAGRWRPILTATSPLWLPELAHRLPALYEILKDL